MARLCAWACGRGRGRGRGCGCGCGRSGFCQPRLSAPASAATTCSVYPLGTAHIFDIRAVIIGICMSLLLPVYRQMPYGDPRRPQVSSDRGGSTACQGSLSSALSHGNHGDDARRRQRKSNNIDRESLQRLGTRDRHLTYYLDSSTEAVAIPICEQCTQTILYQTNTRRRRHPISISQPADHDFMHSLSLLLFQRYPRSVYEKHPCTWPQWPSQHRQAESRPPCP